MTPHQRTTFADAVPVPELPADAALVALVPAIGDLDRAAEAAWEFARGVANAGRRVALIDCYVDAPRLHVVAGEPDGDGIVDVFEYGASLSRIARAQPEGRLFFVPAGTFSPDPAGMMASPRWRRLSAGFRHEHAVMLLFLPPDCIGAVASDLDGLVALAPGGAGRGIADAPEILAALDRGVPLLATFAGAEAEPVAAGAPPSGGEGPSPNAESEPGAGSPEPPPGDADALAPADRPVLRRPAGMRTPRHRFGMIALPIVLLVAVAVVMFRGELGWNRAGGAAEPQAPPDSVTPAFRQLVPHTVDSLPFAVQVAAWTSFTQALEDADTIEGRGFPPIVSPVQIGRTVWYRVYVGPLGSQDAADSVLRAARAAGLDGSNAAKVELVPFSFALRRTVNLEVARVERARMRAAGVASFVLGQGDGSYQLFTGAFDSPNQAAYLDSMLTSTGREWPLGPRVGFRP
jgi:hypothetical protein